MAMAASHHPLGVQHRLLGQGAAPEARAVVQIRVAGRARLPGREWHELARRVVRFRPPVRLRPRDEVIPADGVVHDPRPAASCDHRPLLGPGHSSTGRGDDVPPLAEQRAAIRCDQDQRSSCVQAAVARAPFGPLLAVKGRRSAVRQRHQPCAWWLRRGVRETDESRTFFFFALLYTAVSQLYRCKFG